MHLVIRGFRVVGFGVEKTREFEKKKSKLKSLVNPEDDPFVLLEEKSEDEDEFSEENDTTTDIELPPMMTPDTMAGGILLIDAIGKEARIEFMTGK